MVSRLNPESADFDVLPSSGCRLKRAEAAANARTTSLRMTKARRNPTDCQTGSDRRCASLAIRNGERSCGDEGRRADLARLGYSPGTSRRFWPGTGAPQGSKVSGPVYEGFTLRSVPGKVLSG